MVISENIPPNIVKKPWLYKNKDDGSLVIKVEIIAGPEPVIIWSRDGKQLNETASSTVSSPSTSHQNHSFTLERVRGNSYIASLVIRSPDSRYDTGSYTIRATNPHGSAQSQIELNFVRPEDIDQDDSNESKTVSPFFKKKTTAKQTDHQMVIESIIGCDPEPSIVWFFNDKEIKNQGQYNITLSRLENNTYRSVLTINDLNVENAGTYQINARNANGECNSIVAITFDERYIPTSDDIVPTFTERLHVRQSEDGSVVYFECKLSAFPAPDIQWYFGDKKIQNDDKFKIKQIIDGKDYILSLQVDDVNLDDANQYRIVAGNKAGTTEEKYKLAFELTDEKPPKIYHGIPPRFHNKPIVKLESNLKLIIECLVEANPVADITWYCENDKITSKRYDSTVAFVMKNFYKVVLVIQNPTLADFVNYRCLAINPYGESAANIRLNLIGPKKLMTEGFMPKFLKPTEIVEVFESKVDAKGKKKLVELILENEIEALPEPKVVWDFGSNLIDQRNTRYSFEFTEIKERKNVYKTILKIKNPDEKDHGLYTCTAKNKYGESSQDAYYPSGAAAKRGEEGEKPVFVEELSSKSEEKTIIIEGKVTGTQPFKIKWMKDEKVLSTEERTDYEIHFEASSGKVWIEIKKLSKEYSGEYSCEVSNNYGIAISTTYLDTQRLPEPPGKPSVKEVKATSIVITWKPSDKVDKDFPVIGFKIERKMYTQSEQEWKMICEDCRETTYEDKQVTQTDSYVYRIIAYNICGPSRPSPPSDKISISDKFKKPTITADNLKDQTIHKKKSLKLIVTFESKPHATVEWYKDGDRVESDSHTTITESVTSQEDIYTTELLIKESEMEDEGAYEIRIENEIGKVEEHAKISVIDLPGPPKGPLQISNANGISCTLKWEYPEYDGRSTIKNYYIEKFESDKKKWIHIGNAGDSLNFDVTKLTPGQEYSFRVYSENVVGRSQVPLTLEGKFISKTPSDIPSAPEKPHKTSSSPYYIEIAWEQGKQKPGITVDGYLIERKEKSSLVWEKINEDLVPTLTYTDNEVIENMAYQYRIYAVNKVGPSQASPPSDLIEAKLDILVKTSKPGKPLRPVATKEGKNSAKLEWKIVKDDGNSPITGYIIEVCTPIDENIAEKDMVDKDWHKLKDIRDAKTLQILLTDLKMDTPYLFRIRAYNVVGVGDHSDSTQPAIIFKEAKEEKDKRRPSKEGKEEKKKEKAEKEKGELELKRPKEEEVEADQLDQAKKIIEEKPKAAKKGEVKGEEEKKKPEEEIKPKVDKIKVEPEKPEKAEEIPEEVVAKAIIEKPDRLKEEREKIEKKPGEEELKPKVEKAKLEPEKVEKLPEEEAAKVVPEKPGKMKEEKEKVEKKPEEAIIPKLEKTEDEREKPEKVEKLPEEEAAKAVPEKQGKMKEEKEKLEKKPEEALKPEVGKTKLEPEEKTIGKPEEKAAKVVPQPEKGKGKEEKEEEIKPGKLVEAEKDRLKEVEGKGEKVEKVEEAAAVKPKDEKKEKVKEVEPSKKPEAAIEKTEKLEEPTEKVKKAEEIAKIEPSKKPEAATEKTEKIEEPTEKAKKPEEEIKGVKPLLDTTKIKDQTLKVGETLKIAVPFKAEPQPDVQWKSHGKIISADFDSRFIVEVKPNFTQLTLKDVKRGDEGEISLTVTNIAGEDGTTMKLKVVGKPSPPREPFEVKEAIDNTLTLTWKEPEDDGGSKITNYILEKKEVGKPSWELVNNMVPSTECLVKNLKENQSYQFRVKAENKYGISEALEMKHPVTIQAKMEKVKEPSKKPEAAVEKTEELEEPTEKAKKPEDKIKGVKPLLDTTKIKDQTLKVGETLKIVVPFKAEPQPDVQWKTHGKIISTDLDSRFIVEVKPNFTQLTLKDVKRGDEGEFSLDVTNIAGKDETSMKLQVVGKPSPPREPFEVKEATDNTLTLTWKEPEDDGGSKITNYILEKKEVDKPSWELVNNMVPSTECLVKNLKENQSYQFRVKAENKYGISEALEMKHPVTIQAKMEKVKEPSKKPEATVEKTEELEEPTEKAKKPEEIKGVKPLLDTTKIKDQTLKVGETLKIAVPFKAEPQPDVHWKTHGKIISADLDSRFIVEVKPNFTQLTLKDVKRGDEGEFSLDVTNIAGKDETSMKLKVVGKPSPPREPFEVKEATDNTLTLTWKEPEDDGGSKITNYILEKKEVGKPSWELVNNIVPSTEYLVKNLKENQSYQFRVKAENKYGISEALEMKHPVTIQAKMEKVKEPSKKPEATVEKTEELAEPTEKAKKPEEEIKGVKPLLDTTKIKDQTLKVGETLKIAVPFKAVPQPDVQWKTHGKIISADLDSRFIVEVKPNFTQLTLKDVKRGDEGEFSLAVSNIAGEDETSMKLKVVGKPSPPREPFEVKEATDNTLTLTWKEPEDDGGSKITNYILEKKEVGKPSWELVNNMVPSTECLVKNLKENQSYQFRVKAENKYGISEALEMKHPVTIQAKMEKVKEPSKKPEAAVEKKEELEEPTEKAKKPEEIKGVKPILDTTKIKDQTLKVGETLKIAVPFKAEPQPDVQWKTQEKIISADIDSRFIVEVKPNFTQLTLKDVKRGDEGEFSLDVTNIAGKDETSMKLKVVDKPSPPREPFEVKEATDNTLTLTWKEPEDDGGSKITNYILEKKEVDKPKWEMVNNMVPSTECLVKNLKEKLTYQFRVKAENKYGISEALEMVHPVTIQAKLVVPSLPGKPELKDKDEDFIEIVWTPPLDDGGKPIKEYLVERQDTKTNKWAQIAKVEPDELSFTDKDVIPNGEYKYRLSAVNDIGISEPGPPSEKIRASSKLEKPRFLLDKFPGKVFKIKPGESFDGSFPFVGSPSPSVEWKKNGEIISSSPEFKIENTEGITRVIIAKALMPLTGIYKIKIANEAGKDEVEIKFFVKDKPGPPRGPLQFSDITADSLTLGWKPPLNYGEDFKDYDMPPILGYYVEMMDMDDKKWLAVGKPVGGLSKKVPDLKPGKTYKFRVKAENYFGIGEPLESEPFLFKPPFGVPFLESPLQPTAETKVRARQPLDLGLPIYDSPQPSVDRYKEGVPYRGPPLQPTAETKDRARQPFDLGLPIYGSPQPSVDWYKEGVPYRGPPLQPTAETKDRARQPFDLGLPIYGSPQPSVDWYKEGVPYRGPPLQPTAETKDRARQPFDLGLPIYGSPQPSVDWYKEGPPPPLLMEVPYVYTSGRNYIEVRWNSPIDLGLPYLTYNIERRDDEYPDWKRINTFPLMETRLRDRQIKPDRSYEYRVIPFMESFIGTPGLPSLPYKIEEFRVKPRILIEQSPINESVIKIEIGTPIEWVIPIVGVPRPKVDFFRNGLPLPFIPPSFYDWIARPEDNHPCIRVRIPEIDIDFQGKYMMIAKNLYGTDIFEFKINVLSKPDKPMGPLIIEDIGHDFATISWKRPPTYIGDDLYRARAMDRDIYDDDYNYLVEYRNRDRAELYDDDLDGGWIECGKLSPREHPLTRYRIPDLYYGAPYSFRVRAFNDYGYSLPLESDRDIYTLPPRQLRSSLSPYLDRPLLGSDYPIGPDNYPDTFGYYRHDYGDSDYPLSYRQRLPGDYKGMDDLNLDFDDVGRYFRKDYRSYDEEDDQVMVMRRRPMRMECIEILSPPMNLRIERIFNQDLQLVWDASPDEFTEQFIGYIVEMSLDNYEWLCLNSVPIMERSYLVTDIIEGQDYSFRVRSITLYGSSMPTIPTNTMLMQYDLHGAAEERIPSKFRVREYESLEAIFPHAGFIVREVEWIVNGILIAPSSNNLWVCHPDHIIFLIPRITKEFSGHHSITVWTEFGVENLEFFVHIYGPPSPVIEPIVIDEITIDSCRLSWTPPECNGGSDITNYVIEIRENGKINWCAVAKFSTKPSYCVLDLEPDTEFQFRIFAENIYGLSMPVETCFIRTLPAITFPDAPSSPILIGQGVHFIKIAWKPPLFDGRSPIIGFRVERKYEKDDCWTILDDCHPTNQYLDEKLYRTRRGGIMRKSFRRRTPSFSRKLEGGEEIIGGDGDECVCYRVSAVNRVGSGPMSLPSEYYPSSLCKKPTLINDFGLCFTPKLFILGIKDLFSIKIDFHSDDRPVLITWLKDNHPVRILGTCIEEQRESAIFRIFSCKLEDDGNYECIFSNKFGSISAYFTIMIIDKPSAPVGPVILSEPTESSVTLSWRCPEFLGGNRLTGYSLEFQDMRDDKWSKIPYMLSSPHYTITGLVEGQRYLVKITANNNQGESLGLFTNLIVGLKAPPLNSPFGRPTVEDLGFSDLRLFWDPIQLNKANDKIIGYIIEKRIYGNEWIRVNSVPLSQSYHDVKDLTPSGKYEFRIKALLEDGLSYTSDISNLIAMKRMPCAPSPPLSLDVLGMNEHSVSLSWKCPIDNGGKEITSYEIEIQENYDTWRHILTQTANQNDCQINRLKEVNIYRFRVIAVNEIGYSRASEPTPYICLTDFPIPPKMDADFTSINVSSGAHKDVQIQIPCIFGENTNFDLYYNYKPIRLPAKYSIIPDIASGMLELTIKNLERDDKGMYILEISNKFGKIHSDIHLKVFDTPSKPRQPLSIENLKPDELNLKWLCPKSDGGKPISGYTIQMLDLARANRHPDDVDSWITLISGHKGEEIKIPSLSVGKDYRFKIFAENEVGLSKPLYSDVIRPKTFYKKPFTPSAPQITDWSNEFAVVEWNHSKSDGGLPIKGFILERKEVRNGQMDWNSVHSALISELSYKDGTLMPKHYYQYRVIAVNDIGMSEPSQPTCEIQASPSKQAPKISLSSAQMRGLNLNANQQNPLIINISISGSPVPKVTLYHSGHQIINSANNHKNAYELDPGNDNLKLIIMNPTYCDNGEYELELENKLGKDKATFRIKINDKPSQPREPVKIISPDKGFINIQWKEPSNDGWSNINGYIIEAYNPNKSTWEENGTTCNTSYNMYLDSHVYDLDSEPIKYRLRISAKNINGKSEPLELTPFAISDIKCKPSPVPEPPVAKEIGADYIKLSWEVPHVDGNDAIGYIIEQNLLEDCLASSGNWFKLNFEPIIFNQFKVTQLSPNRQYQFRITALNSLGCAAASAPSQIFTTRLNMKVPSFPRNFQVIPIPPDELSFVWDRPLNKMATSLVSDPNNSGNKNLWYFIEYQSFTANSSNSFYQVDNDEHFPPTSDDRLSNFDMNWIPLNSEPIWGLSYSARQLDPDFQYLFRIYACNEVGASEPYQTEKLMRPPQKLMAPHITTCTLKDTDINPVRDKVSFYVAFKGCPKPKVQWLLDGQEMSTYVNNVQILGDNNGSSSEIVFTNLNDSRLAGKSATLTLNLVNSVGSDARSCLIRVLGPPSAPEGPLTIKFVRPGIYCLAWTPPTETGGCPVLSYVVDCKIIDYKQGLDLFDGGTLLHPRELRDDDSFTTTTEREEDIESEVTAEYGKFLSARSEWITVNDIDDMEFPIVYGPDGNALYQAKPNCKFHCLSLIPREQIRPIPLPEELLSLPFPPNIKFIFRVRALNLIGASKPLVNATPMTIQSEFDLYPSPGAPFIQDSSYDFIKLSWAPTDKEGTRPLLGYDLERLEVSASDLGVEYINGSIMCVDTDLLNLSPNEWQLVNTSGVIKKDKKRRSKYSPVDITKDLCYVDKGVTPGNAYIYRVFAVNFQGRSLPSQISKVMLAREKHFSPKFILPTEFADVFKVKVDSCFDINVSYAADPEPKLIVYKDENKIMPDTSLSWNVNQEQIQLSFPCFTKWNIGNYKLVLENEMGKCKIQFAMDILGGPNVPVGPVCHEFTDDYDLILTWKVPKQLIDEIDDYLIEQIEGSTLLWTRCDYELVPKSNFESVSLSNSALIKHLRFGQKYKFSIKAKSTFGVSDPLITNYIQMPAANKVPDPPRDIEVFDVMSGSVKLRWSPPLQNELGGSQEGKILPLLGYLVQIQRKKFYESNILQLEPLAMDDVSSLKVGIINLEVGEWVNINTYPDTSTEKLIPNLSKGDKVRFRVAAVNKAGSSDFSFPTDFCEVKDKITMTSCPRQLVLKPLPNSSMIQLSWEVPLDEGNLPILNYLIEYSLNTNDNPNWTPTSSAYLSHQSNTSCLIDLKELLHSRKGPLEDTIQFRVLARNGQGLGPPSLPICLHSPSLPSSRNINQYPKITCILEPEYTLMAGHEFDIKIPFICPNTEAEDVKIDWKRDDILMFPNADDRISINKYPHYTDFRIKETSRDDQGNYSLIITNPYGSAEIGFNLIIKDKPAKPYNVKCTECTGENAWITWSCDSEYENDIYYMVDIKNFSQDNWTNIDDHLFKTRIKITDLTIDDKYEIRVSANNLYGQSEYAIMASPLHCKYPFKVPDSPGIPFADVTGKDFIRLKWQTPYSDGGSKVLGYLIEQRDEFAFEQLEKSAENMWIEAKIKEQIDQNIVIITDLLPELGYQFRVSAYNKAGQGPWSQESDILATKTPTITPRILEERVEKDVVAFRGTEFHLVVPYQAYPKPLATWTKGNLELPIGYNTKFCSLSEDHCNTILLIHNIDFSDAGTYCLTLRNDKGWDSIFIKIKVVGPPNSPAKPLTAIIKDKNSVRLSWRYTEATASGQSSSDNPTHYMVEYKKMNDGTGLNGIDSINYRVRSTISPLSVRGRMERETSVGSDIPGPWFQYPDTTILNRITITNLDENGKYLFRVIAINKYGASEPLHLESPLTLHIEYEQPDAPGCINSSFIDEDSMNINWETNNKSDISIRGYSLEYTEVENDTYLWQQYLPPETEQELLDDCDNDIVTRHNEIIVKGLEPFKKYRFRVRTKSSEGVWSNYSELSPILSLKTRIRIPSQPNPPEVLDWGKDFVQLIWKPPINDGGDIFIKYIVEYKDVGGSDWHTATETPISRNKYMVCNLNDKTKYQFRITLVNRAGKSGPSSATEPVKLLQPGDRQGGYYGNRAGDDKLRMIRSIKDVDFALNSTFQMECEISGYPVDKFKWLKNGIELRETERIKYMESGPTYYSLMVTRADDGDKGKYTLTLQNDADIISTTAYAKYIAPPIIIQSPKNDSVSFKQGSTGRIKIFLDGTPPFKYQISKNGCIIMGKSLVGNLQREEMPYCYDDETEELGGSISSSISSRERSRSRMALPIRNYRKSSHARFKMIESIDNVTLILGSVGLADSGEYMFEISNPSGIVIRAVQVKVLGAPSSPKGPVIHKVLNKSEIYLSWSKPDEEGGSPIMHYEIERRMLGKNYWISCNSYCKTTDCTVSDLIPNKKYLFRIYAINEQGKSPYLEPVTEFHIPTHITLPDAPTNLTISDVISQDGKKLCVGASNDLSSTESIQLNWNPPLKNQNGTCFGYLVEKLDQLENYWVPVTDKTFSSIGSDITLSHHKLPSEFGDMGDEDFYPFLIQNTSLRVDGIVPEREYSFRVFSVNEAGKSIRSAECVKPREAPISPFNGKMEVILPLRNATVKEGKTLRMETYIQAPECSIICWFKDQVEICSSLKYNIFSLDSRHILLVHDFNVFDEGEYTCFCTYLTNSVSTGASIMLRENYSSSQDNGNFIPSYAPSRNSSYVERSTRTPTIGSSTFQDRSSSFRKSPDKSSENNLKENSAPSFVDLLKPLSIPERESDLLTCKIEDNLKENSAPSFVDLLKPLSIHEGESDLLTCKVEDNLKENSAPCFVDLLKPLSIPEGESDLLTCKVEVKENSAPRFVDLLKPLSIPEGESVLLTCKVEGNPPPTIIWFKGAEKLDNLPPYQISQTPEGKCTLKITSVAPNQEDDYICIACNALGDSSSSTQLKVIASTKTTPRGKEIGDLSESKPEFVKKLEDIKVQEGHTITVECQIQGIPKPDVTWLFNGNPIEADNIDVFNEDDLYKMTIYNCEKENSGNYTCLSSNSLGQAECLMRLTCG
ncbi:titin-like isoform X3 [Gordionus sp. m RMFG-2023]|uniref:titin-like isoform X3 n=1 Tax=Gordionus sp. m RMFG-2023 TaxID=3053472 RepID=UPI0031FDE26A